MLYDWGIKVLVGSLVTPEVVVYDEGGRSCMLPT